MFPSNTSERRTWGLERSHLRPPRLSPPPPISTAPSSPSSHGRPPAVGSHTLQPLAASSVRLGRCRRLLCLWWFVVELWVWTDKRVCPQAYGARGLWAWAVSRASHVVTGMPTDMNYLAGMGMDSYYPYLSCPTAILSRADLVPPSPAQKKMHWIFSFFNLYFKFI